MKDFLSSLSFKIIIVVVGVIIGLILFGASTGSSPGDMLGVIVNPITKVANAATNATTGFFDQIFGSSHYKKENENLNKQIEQLKKQIVDYDNMKVENEQLKTAAGIKEEHQDFGLVTAMVSSRDADNLYSFNINKGSLSGVEKNDPVITTAGLVGIVTAVAPNFCEVTTILSPDVQVAGYDTRTLEAGTITGKADLAIKGQCRMNHIDKNSGINTGDLLVTSGSSGIFPTGLIIGGVIELGISENGMSSYLTVQPVVDFKTLTDVQIIKSFEGKGGKIVR